MSDNSLNDLEKKLAQFRTESPTLGGKSTAREKDAENLRNGMRAGMELVVSIAAGTLIGWGLDRWLGTKPIFLIVFILAGIGAGFMNVYRITQNTGSAVGFAPLHQGQKQDKTAPNDDTKGL